MNHEKNLDIKSVLCIKKRDGGDEDGSRFLCVKLCATSLQLNSTYFLSTGWFLQCYTWHVSHTKVIKHLLLDEEIFNGYHNLYRCRDNIIYKTTLLAISRN